MSLRRGDSSRCLEGSHKTKARLECREGGGSVTGGGWRVDVSRAIVEREEHAPRDDEPHATNEKGGGEHDEVAFDRRAVGGEGGLAGACKVGGHPNRPGGGEAGVGGQYTDGLHTRTRARREREGEEGRRESACWGGGVQLRRSALLDSPAPERATQRGGTSRPRSSNRPRSRGCSAGCRRSV